MSAPRIDVDPGQSPAWLAGVPDRPLVTGDSVAALEHELARLGLPRPTLWQVECERARRGVRYARR